MHYSAYTNIWTKKDCILLIASFSLDSIIFRLELMHKTIRSSANNDFFELIKNAFSYVTELFIEEGWWVRIWRDWPWPDCLVCWTLICFLAVYFAKRLLCSIAVFDLIDEKAKRCFSKIIYCTFPIFYFLLNTLIFVKESRCID